MMIAIQSANLDFSKMDSILRPAFNITKLVNSNGHKRSHTANNTKQRDDYQDPILRQSNNANIRLILAVLRFGRVVAHC